MISQVNNRQFYRLIPNDNPSRRCFSITKTPDGFMWYLSEDGVCRYDGKYAKLYPIKFSWSGFLCVNNKGNLFLLTTDGVGFQFNASKDRFDKLFQVCSNTLDSVEVDKQSNEIPIAFPDKNSALITSISFDYIDRMWIGVKEGALCFDPQTKSWRLIKSKSSDFPVVSCYKRSLYIFHQENISFVNLKDDLHEKCTVYKVKNTSINNQIVSVLIHPKTGVIYLGARDEGLYSYTNSEHFKQIVSFSNAAIRSLKMYDQNTLLIAYDGLGIYEYDIYEKRIKNHNLVDDNQEGVLGSNAIYDLFVDPDKRLWVATYTNGVNVYDPNLMNFSNYVHQINENNSLCHNNVLSVLEDKNKNLWFGTFNGLSVKKKSNSSWSHFLTNNSRTETNVYVNTLTTDAYGNVLIGGAAGLQIIDPNSFTCKNVDLNTAAEKNKKYDILTVYDDKKYIWTAGLHTDLIRLKLTDHSVYKYPFTFIRTIQQEDENHMLLLHESEIVSFNKLTGEINKDVDKLIKQELKISNPEFISMRQKDDNIWITTRFLGVIQYSRANNSVYVYNTNNGLPSNRVLSVEIDNNDCVWIATNDGLCYLNPVTKILVPFKTSLASEKGLFNFDASTKLSDGTMLFGTKEGAISFDPKKMFVSPKREKLALTEFNVLNKNKNIRPFDEISEVPLNECKEIELKNYENSFTIRFEELIYGHTILPRYSYRLKGVDNAFSKLSTDGSASFYSLSPRKYTLEIRSYFADKEGRYIERSVDIIICQPWYNTIWAWILWIIIAASIGYVIYIYSKRRLDIRYSDEKISFFTNVSHDMRTPITLIKAPLGDLLLDNTLTPGSRQLVQMINNNVNRLFDMINRVLDFEKADGNDMTLNLGTFELNKYVTDIVENFVSYAEVNSITIEAVCEIDPIMVSFDKEKMDMVIENLISNSIKYSKYGGFVKVMVGCNDKKWWIEVYDNGIGIPEKEQNKIFSRFYRAENAINSKKIGSGMGLLLVYNLTQFMGGEVSFESEEGIKTVFKINFPIPQNIALTSQETTTKIDVQQEDTGIPTLLFVDDNDDIRSYISTRLGDDYRVITADSAKAGWDVLTKEKVNIIITDIMMPEVSGIEFCEKIKSDTSFAHIPVVLLSAMADKKDIIKGLQIGADDYITKPFDSVVLKQRIDNILENRKRMIQFIQGHKEEPLEVSKQPFVSEIDKLFFEKLERVFDQNISNSEYTIDLLCRDIGMSRTVFFVKLKNLTNLSPNDYLRIQRMERAADLLSEHKYTVLEVSEMVGYNDVKYFSSLFKKKFGVLPSKFDGR